MIIRISKAVASLFGIGYTPRMPGTVASAVTALALWFLPAMSCATQLAILFVIFMLGTLATHCATNGQGDPSWVVIDELVGMWIALIGLPHHLNVFIAAFVLFRFFDIKKPLGIGYLQHLPGAWGVMLDDCAAGFAAACTLRLIFYIMPF